MIIPARGRTISGDMPTDGAGAPPAELPGTAKTAYAPVLQAKGLSLLWMDGLGESVEPASSMTYYEPGAWSATASPGVGNRTQNEWVDRLSFVTVASGPNGAANARCLREDYPANTYGKLCYRTQYLTTGYREMGMASWVLYPTGFNPLALQSSVPGEWINSGKTMFQLVCGHPDLFNPALAGGGRTWRAEACWPEDQWGCALGVNWTFRNSNRAQVEFDWYAHVLGAEVSGIMQHRRNAYSHLHAIAGFAAPGKQPFSVGTWHLLELYGKMDTNRRDGVVEMWIDGVLRAKLDKVDLGGWVGDRGLYKGAIGPAVPSGTADSSSARAVYSWGDGDLSNSNPSANKGGWRFHGSSIRSMIGGAYSAPHLPAQSSYCLGHNRSVWGRA